MRVATASSVAVFRVISALRSSSDGRREPSSGQHGAEPAHKKARLKGRALELSDPASFRGRHRQQIPAGMVGLYVADAAADQAVELAAGQRLLEPGFGYARDQAPVEPYQHAGHGAQPRLEPFPRWRLAKVLGHELDVVAINVYRRSAGPGVCKILGQEDIKPHKVRYYLERRDAEFEQKMAQVLCVYREVQVLKKAAAKSKKSAKSAAIVSYDEMPGIQVIATTAPDLPPVPNVHATFARDHEYKRHGTLSLLAGIDLLTGKVYALVRDRHRSREFIEFLKLLDAAYPASTAIKLILDNHSAHISRETRAWLDTRPAGRFDFTFTPKHGSWLNLIEGFFSKFARSVLRHIRVASKHELKERIMAGIDDVNRHPVIHTWSYKLAAVA